MDRQADSSIPLKTFDLQEYKKKSTTCGSQPLAVFKMSRFLHENDNDDDTDDTKALAIPLVYAENSQAKQQTI